MMNLALIALIALIASVSLLMFYAAFKLSES